MKKKRWAVFTSLLIIHLAAFVGWIAFSWEGVVCFAVMYAVSAVGITAGYHRLLTHDSFKTYAPIRWAFTLAGMAAAQGTPVEWVATHRKHHKYSDENDDPHSPHHGGFWWSHMRWLWSPFSKEEKASLFAGYARDLMREPFMRFASRNNVYIGWLLSTVAAIGGTGFYFGGWRLLWSFLAYGVFIRLVAVYHITWAVNSATHLWGYRNHETTDQSRNLWWVGLLAFGEGWHNNHHAHQRAANHGQRWWEVDPTLWLIVMLSGFGLAWNISFYNNETDKVEIGHRRE